MYLLSLLLLFKLVILLHLLLSHQQLIGINSGDIVGEIGLAEASVAAETAERDSSQRSELRNYQLSLKATIIQTVQSEAYDLLKPEEDVLRGEEGG